MLRDVVRPRRCRRRLCRWAQVPVIHAASHFYHEERPAWVCSYSYGAPFKGPLGRWNFAMTPVRSRTWATLVRGERFHHHPNPTTRC